MGLDLILLPLRGLKELKETSVFCYDRLEFDRDSKIFCQLIDLGEGAKPTIRTKLIPTRMWITVLTEGGTWRTREDAYGDKLTFVCAKKLRELKMPDNASPKNKAIKAFIDALPENTPIILWWH